MVLLRWDIWVQNGMRIQKFFEEVLLCGQETKGGFGIFFLKNPS